MAYPKSFSLSSHFPIIVDVSGASRIPISEHAQVGGHAWHMHGIESIANGCLQSSVDHPEASFQR